jgi:hypothetical protein
VGSRPFQPVTACKSGLRVDGREGLGSLTQTVQNGLADFENILVYVVSIGAVLTPPNDEDTRHTRVREHR